MLKVLRARGIVVALLVLSACATAQPPRQQPAGDDVEVVKVQQTAPPSAWIACYQNFQPQGDLNQDLEALGRKCGPPNAQHAVSPVRMGEQSESDAVDRYTFASDGSGKCYRVFAVADSTVRDLDVQVLGPDGSRLAADISHDAVPVVPPQGPLCLKQRGVYTVEVSVYKGSGHYALQIWSN